MGAAGAFFGNLLGSARSSDVALAGGVTTILLMLVLPLPGWLLDFMLAVSITFSVLVLMTSLFIEKPLQLSSFPTILLIATMLRLSLNLASTRLILSQGHTGPDAAGKIIEAFGNFLMSGQVVIGIIVFAILIIVNFIVITKGSGRIAEVAARFSLDAMPGKQMAIDADLSAGMISEDEARTRRADLEAESTFFGSMDGAAKFVRGDAVAGLLITFINIIGGLIVGVAVNDLEFGEALSRYTILTIGDGLVSQIPALIVSTAAGLLVTKAGVSGSADKAVFGQLSGYPKALGVSSALLAGFGLAPGLPFLPFAMLSGGLGFLAWSISNKREANEKAAQVAEAAVAAEAAQPAEEPIATALQLDTVRLELGYGLLQLLKEDSDYRLTDQIKALRRQLATEFGFVMPSVRILDNMRLDSSGYEIHIKETAAADGSLRPGMLLAMDAGGTPVSVPGEETMEPAFGLPATWISAELKEEASFKGYTVVDTATVLTTHLTEVIKDNMAEMLSYTETQKLLDEQGEDQQKLIADLIPDRVTLSTVQRVLQTLLNEKISIRDLPTILEGVSDATAFTQSVSRMAEHVRTRLARQLCAAAAGHDGIVPLISLTPAWEQAYADSIHGTGDERQLAMAPSKLQEFIGAVNTAFEEAANMGVTPVLITSPGIRPFVRSVIERFRPQTVVMSQAEIHPKAKIRTYAQV